MEKQLEQKSNIVSDSIPNVLLTDTLKFFNYDEDSFTPVFTVLSKTTLFIYGSAYDTNAKYTINLNTIKDVTHGKPRRFASLSRSKSKDTWLILESLETIFYFCFEQHENAKIWLDNLQKTISEFSSDSIYQSRIIPENIRIAQSDITKEGPVGKGGAASVFKGSWNQTPVAIKEFYDQFDKSEQKSFFDEMTIHASFHHPNIIRLFGGYINSSEKPCMVLEYASKGSLSSILYDSMIDITPSMKLQFIKQIAQALSYLHGFEPSIIHRDLKPANILVSSLFSFFSLFL